MATDKRVDDVIKTCNEILELLGSGARSDLMDWYNKGGPESGSGPSSEACLLEDTYRELATHLAREVREPQWSKDLARQLDPTTIGDVAATVVSIKLDAERARHQEATQSVTAPPVFSSESHWDVLLVLDKSRCALSLDQIADRSHHSKKTIQNVLEELDHLEYTTATNPGHKITDTGIRITAEYRKNQSDTGSKPTEN